jgi:tetratricopeptide (TPR) repeat protein
VAGPEKGQSLRVAPSVTVIGRDASCDLAMAETTISRQHARIERRGEQWILKNLSPNGTLVNKKPIEEEVLADGDEIRLGAKTRLRFVIETVIQASTRPQFRRRASAQEEAAKAGGLPAEGEAEGETPKSIFKRGRKGMALIVLLALPTLLFMVAIIFKLAVPGGTAAIHPTIPVLDVYDQVLLATSAEPLRVERDAPEGTHCKDLLGNEILVTPEDFASGAAKRIVGIRRALDVKPKNEPDPEQARSYVRMALEKYNVHLMPGKEGSLYRAVRDFQQALSFTPGRGRLEDNDAEGKYEDALAELIKNIHDDYRRAIQLDQADDFKKARDMYQHILDMLAGDWQNPIYLNVASRMDLLRTRHPELQR